MKSGISAIVSIVGTTLSAWLGGWDSALQFLALAMVLDYITGILVGIKNKNLNSEIMFWGGLRKALTLVVVLIAVKLDVLVGNEHPIFRTLAIYFYIGREGLSIVENLGLLNVPLPPFVKSVLSQIKSKGEVENTDEMKN